MGPQETRQSFYVGGGEWTYSEYLKQNPSSKTAELFENKAWVPPLHMGGPASMPLYSRKETSQK
jgi:hypothetical protein